MWRVRLTKEAKKQLSELPENVWKRILEAFGGETGGRPEFSSFPFFGLRRRLLQIQGRRLQVVMLKARQRACRDRDSRRAWKTCLRNRGSSLARPAGKRGEQLVRADGERRATSTWKSRPAGARLKSPRGCTCGRRDRSIPPPVPLRRVRTKKESPRAVCRSF